MKLIKCRKTALVIGPLNDQQQRFVQKHGKIARHNEWSVPIDKVKFKEPEILVKHVPIGGVEQKGTKFTQKYRLEKSRDIMKKGMRSV